MKKHIVILSHYFNPYKYIGAKRASYMAEYLSQRDYNLIVLKAHNIYYGDDIDNSLIGNKYVVINIQKKNNSNRSVYLANKQWRYQYKQAIKNLIKQYEIACLYFSGDPFFYFTLGPYFKKAYGIPYILDFRDPWYQDIRLKSENKTRPRFSPGFKKRIRHFRLVMKEKSVIRDAAYIINVTQRRTDVYKQYYHYLDQSKFITIPNGYNDIVFNKLNLKGYKKEAESRFFNIGIFGKFAYYNTKSVDLLTEGVKKLMDKLNFQIHHYGMTEEYFMESVRKNNLEKVIKFHGFMDYRKGIAEMAGMDWLILNNRDTRSQGTKIFDYIYLNKPIIAFIQKNSEIGDLLGNFKNSFIVENVDHFINAIMRLQSNDIRTLDEKINVENYSRKASMMKLSEYLDEFM